MMTKIVLEDKGQDLLWLRVNEGGLVEEAGPFQNEIWKGSYIPIWLVRVGQLLPIHHYPHIIHGFLKYKVKSIKKRTMMTKIEMQAMDAVIGIHREMRKANEPDWEQRRYEIAKECVAALMHNEITLEDVAKISVEQADALIKELKKEK